MASHTALFRRLAAAIKGEKPDPLGIPGGSVNYRMMDRATACIAKGAQTAFSDLLAEQEQEGHLTLRGPKGVACEQGSPAMHWSYNCASVAGVLNWAISEEQDQMRKDCVLWFAHEAGLDRHYRFKDGRVYMPAPRIKNEKGQGPVDGYRDVFLALALGENVNKPSKYWDQREALAVKTFRDVLPKLTAAERQQIQNAPKPKLYLPIEKTDLPDGGYLLELPDSQDIRKALGKDVCHWVHCPSEGQVTWRYDWKDPIGQETA